MNAGKGFFDASAYMLFEASGDSESPCLDGGALDLEYDEVAAAGEDDAQSCSYVSSAESEINCDAVSEKVGFPFPNSAVFDYCCDEEEDDDVFDQCDVVEVRRLSKSEASEDSSVKTMNERESDRQFWEACLAS